MTDERIIPVFRVADAAVSAPWYARLGFAVRGTHQFEPGFPVYMFLQRGAVALHLSEHTGDAPHRSLVFMEVDDLDAIAAEFGATIADQPWGRREVQLADPDGNRLRISDCPTEEGE